jgi:hypothetical protein
MAHMAQLDENNVVTNVIVVNNNELLDNGTESEDKGVAFCKSLFGIDTRWVQTSFNRTFRKNFAGVGYTYDPIRDAFYSAACHEEAILNEENCYWECTNTEHTVEVPE